MIIKWIVYTTRRNKLYFQYMNIQETIADQKCETTGFFEESDMAIQHLWLPVDCFILPYEIIRYIIYKMTCIAKGCICHCDSQRSLSTCSFKLCFYTKVCYCLCLNGVFPWDNGRSKKLYIIWHNIYNKYI